MGINISANSFLCPDEDRRSGEPTDVRFTENSDAIREDEIAIEIPVSWSTRTILEAVISGGKLTIIVDKADLKRIADFLSSS